MTAERYLRQYEYATLRESRLKEEYEAECELIDSVRSSADVDGMPHARSINKSVEDRAIKLADKALKWKMAALDALQIRMQVFDVIDQIEGVKGEILFQRYIRLRDFIEICKDINYSRSQTYRLHQSALEEVEDVIRRIDYAD